MGLIIYFVFINLFYNITIILLTLNILKLPATGGLDEVELGSIVGQGLELVFLWRKGTQNNRNLKGQNRRERRFCIS